jgi:transposase
MVTRVQRLQVTLEQETLDTVRRISRITGTPAARIVADMIDEWQPMLDQIATLVEQADKLNGKASAMLKTDLRNRAALLQKLAFDAQGIADTQMLDFDMEIESNEL